MKPSLVALITTVPTILLLAINVFQTVIWTRRERVWVAERTRLMDAIISRNAAEFRIRQTTKVARLDDEDEAEPRRAAPNERPHRPMPIGLGGGMDAG